eukprot:CAMPEP_0119296606 /NCGR_PEP_ID=MMETSP1329-20130426/50657_1 /TAXON_ID=114041 /ORGANISM="Genus nov. species nov., Strain RCC1024" /LENGTH=356 /DNA_ID=CAMNT_0007297541 /DNA_START=163 /DNA_END=1233 /DNA_ORIENTATION=-
MRRSLAALLASAAAVADGFDLMSALLKSPLYRQIMVPMSRNLMIDTAKKNGVPWADSVAWLERQREWTLEGDAVAPPAYYEAPFHAYDSGNLCWQAAFEQEVASKAVGARNYPAFGAEGETAFRGAFDDALVDAGARVPDDAVVVDLGCGTGYSTRRLAEQYPRAAKFVGVDLSPYFVAVARELPRIEGTEEHWVNAVQRDERVSFECADAASTPLESASADVCVLTFVVHELPPSATAAIVREAHRLLKPGGQLWINEMDFETEGYAKLRASPAYAFIRATEPYLDVYADHGATGVAGDCVAAGFGRVKAVAATGRHYSLVADRVAAAAPEIVDLRAETAKPDTHLKTWELREDT